MALQSEHAIAAIATGIFGSICFIYVSRAIEQLLSSESHQTDDYLRNIHHCEVSKDELYAERQSLTCSALSVSYANTNPLIVQCGKGQYLFDADGTRYLDTRNNVAHVGHCHPAVVKAVQAQVEAVCTNSRYLHPNFNLLIKRLLSTLPPYMQDDYSVFFVNSGSEANDLALRVAAAATGSKAKYTLTLERAYHGHSEATIAISPYKFANRRYQSAGWTAPSTTLVMPAPDVYRTAQDSAAQLAAPVIAACRQHHGNIKAMIVESGMSVAGVILPPKGYLNACFQAVRQAGGVCICDEVQTGLGRLGTWWCFELQEVAPDIITTGKPFGNGLPLAAVIVRKSLAEAFAQGPEYFNTFGGNNVSVVAGLAVLDVIEREQLMMHARNVGAYLVEALHRLPAVPGCMIGDVRGQGLFVGAEFVQDGGSKAPATMAVSWLCSQLKDKHHILTSIDGPHDNVLVIKPPMCFNCADVDMLTNALKDEMVRLQHVDLTSIQMTPT
eukprot:TRINITY_DN12273_c2_g1_i1.p1 TRINITY_DN12273_c2_g1~~TRINITY_DN12273_c2_g1_i1.p1  ORF type:complete len:498 (-),score=85.84 TRINITY_DN12273_c2_g1_i1:1375-2868(-)